MLGRCVALCWLSVTCAFVWTTFEHEVAFVWTTCELEGVLRRSRSFERDRMVRYEGREVYAFHNLDINNCSYFEALGLIKDLGEEKGNLGMDDGFKDTLDQHSVVKENVMKIKTTPIKNPIQTFSKRAKELSPKRAKRKIFEGQCSGVDLVYVDPEVFRAPDVKGMDKNDEDYVGDELHSDLDEGYNSENNDKPKYPTFQKEEMCKEFKFSLGMEFRSLKEFKHAILKHFVLNGREVVFVKNDNVRCSVKCKRDYEFMAFVSKVGRTSTYRLKTLVGRHTCGCAFHNKNASL
ncbi:Transposase, MuDR, plant [Sesbania bispinosa]|nr:Transposase, MuDR, plant [Sesbania bispinosa]